MYLVCKPKQSILQKLSSSIHNTKGHTKPQTNQVPSWVDLPKMHFSVLCLNCQALGAVGTISGNLKIEILKTNGSGSYFGPYLNTP